MSEPINIDRTHFVGVASALEEQNRLFLASLQPALGLSSAMSELAARATRQIRILDAPSVAAQSLAPLIQSALSMKSMLATLQESAARGTAANLALNWRSIDTTFADMARPAFEAARMLEAATALRGLAFPDSPLGQLKRSTLSFAETATSAMTALARNPEQLLTLPPWLQRAPSIEQYAAARVITVLASEPSGAAIEDTSSETQLKSVGDELEGRLAAANVDFVAVYRGAIDALNGQGPDWRRHVGTSLRELADHLLVHLAPDDQAAAFHTGNPGAIRDGELTRRARLEYVFRNIAVGEYARMAEEDMELMLATFYPANEAVHRLVSRLTKEQARVFLRRVQGCISTILEAAGL